jgi:cobalt-zinc-cadmium efflux system protein
LRSAWKVVTQAGHILLEGTPEDLDAAQLKQVLMESVPDVRDVHHIHIWSLTPAFPLLTLHVNVGDQSDYAKVLNQVKHVLIERFNIEHSTVQIESTHCVDQH